MNQVKASGKKLAVMYSGGIDSTAIVCSLLKNCSEKDIKENVIVLLSDHSILENQNFHYPAEPGDAEKIKEQFREMFYPSDPIWRKAVIEQADARMAQVMKYLNAN